MKVILYTNNRLNPYFRVFKIYQKTFWHPNKRNIYSKVNYLVVGCQLTYCPRWDCWKLVNCEDLWFGFSPNTLSPSFPILAISGMLWAFPLGAFGLSHCCLCLLHQKHPYREVEEHFPRIFSSSPMSATRNTKMLKCSSLPFTDNVNPCLAARSSSLKYA